MTKEEMLKRLQESNAVNVKKAEDTLQNIETKEVKDAKVAQGITGLNSELPTQKVIEKEVKFYNVITDKHYNLFANGILTSCRLSNKYRIEDMKYVGKKLISDEQEKAYFERIENKRK